MLTIRASQMRVFDLQMKAELERQVAEHAKAHFPQAVQALGAGQLAERAALGVSRAREHGFESRAELFSYVNLMFVLGPDFDRDPALPWVQAPLRSGQRPELRMAALHAAALDHLGTPASLPTQR